MSDDAVAKGLPTIDVHEYGGKKDGERQKMNRRLFMQLLVFDVDRDPTAWTTQVESAMAAARVGAVLYADTMDPRGVGVLTWSEDPGHFATTVRAALGAAPPATNRRAYGLIGRSYATGHEPELEWSLLRRPIENVSNAAYPWHVWYPLRRTGAFAKLEPIDQSHILREHAALGMAYGHQELAHDIRLACHGLDASDNEFVIGLVGKDLHPLSHLVQAMRKTRQTSEFIAQMGPFFVGHVVGRSAGA